MDVLFIHAPGDVRLDRVARPRVSPGSVIVRVIAAPVWEYVVCLLFL